jgi:hypothetical protein
MAKTIKLRKNNITNNWEHWIYFKGSNVDGYWAEGVWGNDENNDDLLKDTSNIDQFNNIILYEEFENKRQQVELAIKTYNIDDLVNFDDITIYELLEQSGSGTLNCQNIPIVTKIFDTEHPDWVTSDKEINNVFYEANLQFSSDVENPCENSTLNYYWLLNGNQEATESFYSQNYSDDIFITETKSKSILCRLENLAGSTISPSLNINIYNPLKSKLFNRNLIKNNYGKDGLANWIVTKGDPKVYTINEEFKKTGFFDSNSIIDLHAWDTTLPTKSELFYFMGGETTPDNSITSMYQLIDVSEISEYIDGTIFGLGNIGAKVYATLYGLFGKWGTSGCWKQLQQPTIKYEEYLTQGYVAKIPWVAIDHQYPNAFYRYYKNPETYESESYHTMCTMNYCIGDRSRMVVSFLNEFDEKIGNNVILKSNNFSYLYQETRLRAAIITLPVGTRTIKVELIFEKDFDVKVTDYQGAEDVLVAFPNAPSLRPLNPGILFNVRPWENPKFHYESNNSAGSLEYHLDHLSMATLLSCKLGLIEKLPTDESIYTHRQLTFSNQRPSNVATYYNPNGTSGNNQNNSTLPEPQIYFYKKPVSLAPSGFVLCDKLPDLWKSTRTYIKNSASSTGWCTDPINGDIYRCKKTHTAESSNKPGVMNPNGTPGLWVNYWEYLGDVACYIQQQSNSLLDDYSKGNGIEDQGFPDNITQLITDATNCPADKYYKASCT